MVEGVVFFKEFFLFVAKVAIIHRKMLTKIVIIPRKIKPNLAIKPNMKYKSLKHLSIFWARH
jgi:hypothetical protein